MNDKDNVSLGINKTLKKSDIGKIIKAYYNTNGVNISQIVFDSAGNVHIKGFYRSNKSNINEKVQ